MRKHPGLSKRPNGSYYQINKTVRYRGQVTIIRETTGTGDRELATQIYLKRIEEEQHRLIHGLRFPFTVNHAAAKLLQTAVRNRLTDTYHLDMLVEYMGEVELADIHNEHHTLVKFKRDRLKTCKNNTVNRTLEILRLILNLATNDWVDNGKTWIASAPKIRLLPRNPGKNSDQSKGESAGYPLPRDIQPIFFRELPMHLYKTAWFALMTGCREHEIIPYKDKETGVLTGGLR